MEFYERKRLYIRHRAAISNYYGFIDSKAVPCALSSIHKSRRAVDEREMGTPMEITGVLHDGK